MKNYYKIAIIVMKVCFGLNAPAHAQTEDSTTFEPIAYPDRDLFVQGELDASNYYKGYKGVGTGTLITGLVSPLVGLIPAIACSATPPKPVNLNFPYPELIEKGDYYHGYTQKSKKIKQGKVWTNWGIAFGVNFVAVMLLAGQ